MTKFKEYCISLLGQYNNNIKKITIKSTDRIFHLIKNPNKEIFFSKNITIGKFYIIKYNYNGNEIWCPIFVIDDRYKLDIQKRIIYAINLDYLPYNYRILFFDILFDSFYQIIEYNKNENIDIEKPLKINFEIIYRLLKNNGNYQYSITAFDYLKIVDILNHPKIYFVSTNIASRFMFINTKYINLKNMKNLYITLEDSNLKNKLNNIIEYYENIKNDLDIDDQKFYYNKLKNFEKKFKLIEN